ALHQADDRSAPGGLRAVQSRQVAPYQPRLEELAEPLAQLREERAARHGRDDRRRQPPPEQLGWRLPTAVVAPMAGGSLLSKLRKGFGEFLEAGLVRGNLPRLYGAQAAGCAPIVRLVERGGDVRSEEHTSELQSPV